MRQVPHYLLIGNGRVATHFQHYFSLLQLSFTSWNQAEPIDKLHQQLTQATHILVLISDQAIEPFVLQHLKNTHAICIHFSGSLVSDHIYGAHPLMTFNKHLYNLEQYQTIPFVIDHNAPANENLLPGLPNPCARLDKSKKAKYHALCVLSGNFSCMLWQKFFTSLETEFNLPASIGQAYLQQQTQNILSDYASALTGPLTRNDHTTIEKNLAALSLDPFQEVYQSFVSCYQQKSTEIK
jgi:predicted short-subunit dehydrogenase-like oxidoreductase (DUF2520 family)